MKPRELVRLREMSNRLSINTLQPTHHLCNRHAKQRSNFILRFKQRRLMHTSLHVTNHISSEFIVRPHIDLRALFADIDAVKHNLQARHITNVDVDAIHRLYANYSSAQQAVQSLRAERNTLSKTKPSPQTVERSKATKQQLTSVEADFDALERQLYNELYKLPNTISPHTPLGTEQQYKVLDVRNDKAPYADGGISHIGFCDRHKLIDLQAAATTTGSRFVYLKHECALLELALIQYAMHTLVRNDYTPVSTPDLVRTGYIEACGFMPRETADVKAASQVYHIADTDMSLIGTSEHCLAAMHSNTMQSHVPLRYAAHSHCFRTESGAYGTASKGLYRLHQFSKVEMFALTDANSSTGMFDEMIDMQMRLYDALQLHYRVIEIASGDLGASAHRKIDMEAYMPYSRGDYGEISSTSNCTDYQSRRLNIRHKRDGNNQFVHTLNGTAVAIPRLLISIIEQNQFVHNNEICVRVPDVLQPYMMDIDAIPSQLVKR